MRRGAVLLLGLALSAIHAGSCGRARHPNLLLVGIDTLRADAVGFLGSTAARTPRLDHLARDAVVFEQASAPANWTLPSFSSLLTGLLPEAHGATTPRSRLPPAAETLAERLRAAGYATAAYTAGGYVHRRFGLDQGFDSFDDETESGHFRDKLRRSLEWARARSAAGEPWFLFLHGYDVHAPYAPSRRPPPPPGYVPPGADLVKRFVIAVEEGRDLGGFDPGAVVTAYLTIQPPGVRMLARFRRAFRRWEEQLPRRADELWRSSPDFESALEWVRANYLREVEELDHDLEPLLRFVLSPERSRDTVLALVADHGEAFLEHGRSDHVRLDEEVLHVPLVLRGPGLPARRVPDAVSTLDLPATLLELTALGGDRFGQGKSLLPLVRGDDPKEARAVVAYRHTVAPGTPPESSIRVRGMKLRTGGDFGEHAALFDLVGDPLEQNDLAASRPEAAGELRRRLEAITRRCRALRARLGGAAADLRSEDIEELTELGYLGWLGKGD